MSTFKPGQTGNPKGRPTKEEQAIRDVPKSELDASVRLIRRSIPRALRKLLSAIDNPDLTLKDQLKYSKEIWDMYRQALALDAQLKREGGVSDLDTEDEEDKLPAVIFKIV